MSRPSKTQARIQPGMHLHSSEELRAGKRLAGPSRRRLEHIPASQRARRSLHANRERPAAPRQTQTGHRMPQASGRVLRSVPDVARLLPRESHARSAPHRRRLRRAQSQRCQ